jgi:hypothetical protein
VAAKGVVQIGVAPAAGAEPCGGVDEGVRDNRLVFSGAVCLGPCPCCASRVETTRLSLGFAAAGGCFAGGIGFVCACGCLRTTADAPAPLRCASAWAAADCWLVGGAGLRCVSARCESSEMGAGAAALKRAESTAVDSAASGAEGAAARTSERRSLPDAFPEPSAGVAAECEPAAMAVAGEAAPGLASDDDDADAVVLPPLRELLPALPWGTLIGESAVAGAGPTPAPPGLAAPVGAPLLDCATFGVSLTSFTSASRFRLLLPVSLESFPSLFPLASRPPMPRLPAPSVLLPELEAPSPPVDAPPLRRAPVLLPFDAPCGPCVDDAPPPVGPGDGPRDGPRAAGGRNSPPGPPGKTPLPSSSTSSTAGLPALLALPLWLLPSPRPSARREERAGCALVSHAAWVAPPALRGGCVPSG